MAISIKDLKYHPKILDSEAPISDEFEEADGKVVVNISMANLFQGMPENYFDWPEAKIVARYWTKECTKALEEEIEDKDFSVLGSSFNKKMRSLIGDKEYKSMLEELKQAKIVLEPEELWIHGYTTPPIYFAEALSNVLRLGADLKYLDKSATTPLDLEKYASNSIKTNNLKIEEINPPLNDSQDLSDVKKCISCRIGNLSHKVEKFFFGLFSRAVIVCDKCEATFKKTEGGYKFIYANGQTTTAWKEYGGQTLSAREWVAIGNGGMSDAKQRVTDIENWLEKLRKGSIKVKFEGVETPVFLKLGEELLFTLPEVTLKEPRAVYRSSGGYAGPSFRVAKGVYFRLGRFGSTGESHQEIRTIDKGILTITSERFIFSGNMKTINIDLRKIVQIDPFLDAFALHRDGREKTQYFTWNENMGRLHLSAENRSYSEPINGLILKCAIDGARTNFYKSKR